MANALVHPTKVIDAINCATAAEVMAAIEQMGMSLDLACTVKVSLIEETLSDGSKAQSIVLRSEDDADFARNVAGLNEDIFFRADLRLLRSTLREYRREAIALVEKGV